MFIFYFYLKLKDGNKKLIISIDKYRYKEIKAILNRVAR